MRPLPEDRVIAFMKEHGYHRIEFNVHTLKVFSDLVRAAENDAIDDAAALVPDLETRLPILALKNGAE
jgi:hypothetical protein